MANVAIVLTNNSLLLIGFGIIAMILLSFTAVLVVGVMGDVNLWSWGGCGEHESYGGDGVVIFVVNLISLVVEVVVMVKILGVVLW